MADVKVSALTELLGASLDVEADSLLVSDMSVRVSKRMTPAEFLRASVYRLRSSVYDFTTGDIGPFIAFTRASSGTRVDSAGLLASETTDAPRFQYDPATLTPRGLLIESSQTNSMRNNTMIGAVAGTPGTAPTNLAFTGSTNGITREIVGTGTEDGIEYIDVRYSGTPTASTALTLANESFVQIVASAGQVWQFSIYLRLVAGTLANTTVRAYIFERGAAGVYVADTSVVVVPTSAALRTQRFAVFRTFTEAATAYSLGYVNAAYTNGLAIDFTLRFGLPQVTSGSALSTPIKTSTAAATRSTETAVIFNPAVLTDQCWIVKGRTPASQANYSAVAFQVDDGTINNRRMIYYTASGVLAAFANVGGVTQASLNLGAVALDTDFAVAVRWTDNNFAASLNGGAVVTDLSGTNPFGLTTARVGSSVGANHFGSTIRSIETRRTASNAELQALSV